MFRRVLFFLSSCVCLISSPGLHAATLSILSDGSDGSFAATLSTTLSLDNTQTFNFTYIQISTGAIVNFNQAELTVNFLGSGDIAVTGTLDASFLDLTVTTPGHLAIDGEILARSLRLEAADLNIPGVLNIQNSISMMAGNSTAVGQNAEIISNGVVLTTGDIDAINQSVSGGTTLISGSGVVLLPSTPVTLAPVPAALWLFGSGLPGLIGLAMRKAARDFPAWRPSGRLFPGLCSILSQAGTTGITVRGTCTTAGLDPAGVLA